MSRPAPISRREAIQRLSVLVGGAMSSSTVAALLSGCEAAPAPAGWTPAVLSAAQLDVLTAVVDVIIPRTGTPGAVDVGVPAFIDLLLDRWAEQDQRSDVLAGLDQLGEGFLSLDAEARATLLTPLDEEGVRAREAAQAREPVQARDDDDEPLPWFATLKEWTLSGYYTSEAGATQELRWLAIPGRWDADIPLDEVGRSWA